MQRGGDVRVTCLIKHPPESGTRNAADGKKLPNQYVQVVLFEVNGETVATADLGPGVSADPLVSPAVARARSGDSVTVAWQDNLGNTGQAETRVK